MKVPPWNGQLWSTWGGGGGGEAGVLKLFLRDPALSFHCDKTYICSVRVEVLLIHESLRIADRRTQQKQRIKTFGDSWVIKQHHWNTGAKENHQLNSDEPRNRHKKFRPRPCNE